MHEPTLALAASAWLLAATPAPAPSNETAWSLHPRTCADLVSSALRVPCGSYGVFHFFPSDTAGCAPVSAGLEAPALYPRVDVKTTAQPGTIGSIAGRAAGTAERAATAVPNPPQPAAPWLAVIDWQDAHGASVVALVEQMAAGAAAASLFALDGDDLAPLGDEVGDAHVLARLCAVAEETEEVRGVAPVALNMSFGRLPGSGDAEEPGSCAGGQLACQIAHVLAHLRALGAAPVAAAGNHGQLLFPAVLPDALAAASLDVTHFLQTGVAAPLWESPPAAEVVVPGHALCVEGAVVPAGTSYASAFFAGWLAYLAAAEPGLDASAGPWAPAWSAAAGCYVLAQAGVPLGACNPGLGQAAAGIVGGAASGCWEEPSAGGQPVLAVGPPGAPADQPPVQSFDLWAARQQKPAPEADPCIPCVDGDEQAALMSKGGAGLEGGEDVLLNLSASLALDPGLRLAGVHVRIGQDFYPLELTPTELAAVAEGGVGGILLAGWRSLLTAPAQPSLFYVLTADPSTDCTAPAPLSAACFWRSTPILLP